MYSQKWNCAASLFPKRNYNVLSPNSYTHISVRDLYIFPRIGSVYFAAAQYVDRSCEYINRSQTHECRNWERGRAVSFLGIFVSTIGYSVFAVWNWKWLSKSSCIELFQPYSKNYFWFTSLNIRINIYLHILLLNIIITLMQIDELMFIGNNFCACTSRKWWKVQAIYDVMARA